MIDPTFININRLFVLSFKNGNNDPTRDYFDKYYMPLLEIKDFNALIDNKPFFDQPVKNKQEAYEKLIEMSRNDDYTTGNLLDYLYHNYRGDITIAGHNLATQVAFKNCAPFTKCNETTLDDAETSDLVMSMHNLIVPIILKQQEFYGFILKMKQLVLIIILQTLMILNLSSIRLNY